MTDPSNDPIKIPAGDAELVDGLLLSMFGHWPAIGRTSISGVRESFLRRDGVLFHSGDGWQLEVEPRAFDVLLNRLPSGYGVCRLPWMNETLHSQWR